MSWSKVSQLTVGPESGSALLSCPREGQCSLLPSYEMNLEGGGMSLPTQAVSSPVPFPFLLPRRVAPSSYIQYCSSNFGAWRFQASQQRGLDSAKEIQRLPPMNARSVFSPPKSRLGSGCPWLMATWLHVS